MITTTSPEDGLGSLCGGGADLDPERFCLFLIAEKHVVHFLSQTDEGLKRVSRTRLKETIANKSAN